MKEKVVKFYVNVPGYEISSSQGKQQETMYREVCIWSLSGFSEVKNDRDCIEEATKKFLEKKFHVPWTPYVVVEIEE